MKNLIAICVLVFLGGSMAAHASCGLVGCNSGVSCGISGAFDQDGLSVDLKSWKGTLSLQDKGQIVDTATCVGAENVEHFSGSEEFAHVKCVSNKFQYKFLAEEFLADTIIPARISIQDFNGKKVTLLCGGYVTAKKP